MTTFAVEGTIYEAAGSRIVSYRYDPETSAFSRLGEFELHPRCGPEPELVAAAVVLDAGCGLRLPVLAFRARAGGGAWSYSLGTVDLRARRFGALRSFELPAACEDADFLVADGPALCIVHTGAAEGASTRMLSVVAALDSGEAVGGALWSVPLHVEAAAFLGAVSLSGEPEDGLALLLVGKGPASRVVAHAIRERAPSRPSSPPRPHTAQTQLERACPALASLPDGAVSCVSAQWGHFPEAAAGGTRGAAPLRPTLRLWVGAAGSSGEGGRLLCCGCGGEPAPLLSFELPSPPLCVELVELLHGQPVAVVLLAAGAARAGETELGLYSMQGAALRSVPAVTSWLAHDCMRLGHPQLLLSRPAARGGRALIGASTTWADGGAEAGADVRACIGGDTAAARQEAAARRRNLREVAAALADRVAAGHEAVEQAAREVRGHRLLISAAEEITVREASRPPPPPPDEPPPPQEVNPTIARWKAEMRLVPIDLKTMKPMAPPPPAPPMPQAAPPAADDAAEPPGLRVCSLRHGCRHGAWLLSGVVLNAGDAAAFQIGASLTHPHLPVSAHGGAIPRLDPGATAMVTLAAPLAPLAHRAADAPGTAGPLEGRGPLLDLDLLLSWCTAPATGGGGGGGGDAAEWRRTVAARVRLDTSAMFSAAWGATPAAPAGPEFALPPGLTRTAHLVVEAPADSAARVMHGLPRTLATLLGLRLAEPLSDAAAAAASAALPPAPPPAHPLLLGCTRGAIGEGGLGVSLEIAISAVGRCAEIALTATGGGGGADAAGGGSAEAVLTGAVSTVRAALDASLKLQVSYGSLPTLHCLRRAALATQAELSGAARACEEFAARAGADGGGEEEDGGGEAAAMDLLKRIASLQSETDAQASVLHGLLTGLEQP